MTLSIECRVSNMLDLCSSTELYSHQKRFFGKHSLRKTELSIQLLEIISLHRNKLLPIKMSYLVEPKNRKDH